MSKGYASLTMRGEARVLGADALLAGNKRSKQASRTAFSSQSENGCLIMKGQRSLRYARRAEVSVG
jgi:hypothetical protein